MDKDVREKMLKISYILPCYNVERYIKDCLDSIYAQDIEEDEFEVICVNDCSTDSTRTIISEYSKEHANLILINHKENLTAGGARNTGIEAAKGEYIWFVDPDDMIIPSKSIDLFHKSYSQNLDIIFFNNDVVYENLKYKESQCFFTDSEVMSGQNFIETYFPNRLSDVCIVWRCLFNTSFLKDECILFPHIKKSQDVSFMWESILCAKRVCSISDVGYKYRINPYSVANKLKEPDVFFSERILFAYEIVRLLKSKRKLNKPIEDELYKTLYWCANSNLNILSQMPYNKLTRYYSEITHNKDALISIKPYMNAKSRFLFSLYCCEFLWILKVKFLGII